MEQFDETSAMRKCPKCGKTSLTQAGSEIKCTSCGYNLDIPKI